MPTVKASTRSDGSDTLTTGRQPQSSAGLVVDGVARTDAASMPEKSAVRQRGQRHLVVAGAAQARRRPWCGPGRPGARAPAG